MKKITQKTQLQILLFCLLIISTSVYAQVGVGIIAPLNAQFTVNEDAIFNESGGDFDFRIESDGNINMFNIDAGRNLFGFNALPNNVSALGGYVSQIYGVFEVGNDLGTGYQIAIGPYLVSDPVIAPETDFYGYNGVYDFTNQNAWYEVNSYDYYNISNRQSKRNIISINDHKEIENYVMNDIDKIKPSFYKYHTDMDQFVAGNENKYRPQMRLGVITDEAPDYLTDATNSKVSIYSVATMSLVGVKHNRSKIKEIENKLELRKISDFGTVTLNGKEVYVNFEIDFSKKLLNSAIITATTNNPDIHVSITKKSKSGFLIVSPKEVSNLSIDWIAMGKTDNINKNPEFNSIDLNLKSQLEIPEVQKQKIINSQKSLKSSSSSEEKNN